MTSARRFAVFAVAALALPLVCVVLRPVVPVWFDLHALHSGIVVVLGLWGMGALRWPAKPARGTSASG